MGQVGINNPNPVPLKVLQLVIKFKYKCYDYYWTNSNK